MNFYNSPMSNVCTLADCPQKRDLAGVASALAAASNLLVDSIESDCTPDAIDENYQRFVLAKDHFVDALRSYRTHVTEERAGNGTPGETRTHIDPFTDAGLEIRSDTGA